MEDGGDPGPTGPDNSGSTPAYPWERRGVAAAALAVAVCLAYASALQSGFVFDDNPLVGENARIRSLANLPLLWSSSYWGPDSPHLHYRPVTLTSLAFDWALWGPRPFGFHLTNLLLHLAVVLLLRELLVGLFADAGLAFLAALLFAVHPLHTDAVTPVAGRAELLAFGFVLMALLAHRRALGASERGFRVWTAMVGAAVLLGALAKESALAAPALLWWGDRMAPAAGTGRRTWIGVGAGAVAVAAFFLLRWGAVGALGTGVQIYDALGAGTGVRLARAFAVLGDIFRLHVVPWPLAADYAVNHRGDLLPIAWSASSTLLGLGGSAVLGLVAAAGLRRPGVAAYGAGWFLFAAVPVSNLVVQIGIVAAERIYYIPSAGGLLLLAIGILALRPREDGALVLARRLAFSVALAASYGGFSLLTLDRNLDWFSNVTIFEDLIAKDPENPTGWIGISSELRDMHRVDEAVEAAERAVAQVPGKPAAWAALGSAAFTAGELAAVRGDPEAARAAWRRCADAYGRALDRADSPGPRRRRAAALALLGEREAALRDLETARTLAPDDPEVWTDLGIFWSTHAEPRDAERSRAAYARALELLPTHARAHFNRGLDALQRGAPAAALPDLESAFRLDPSLRAARLAAAQAASDAGVRVTEAIRWVEEAIAERDADLAAWTVLESIHARHGPPERLAEVRERIRALRSPGGGH